MSDQTPTDPLRSFIAVETIAERHHNTVTLSGEAVEAYRAADVDRARAAEREQHQRQVRALHDTIERQATDLRHEVELREQHQREIANARRSTDYWKAELKAANDEVAQRDETIRQLQARLAHAQQFYAVRLKHLEDFFRGAGRDLPVAAEFWNIIANGRPGTPENYQPPIYAQLLNAELHRADAAEARCATLTQALEQAKERAEIAKAFLHESGTDPEAWLDEAIAACAEALQGRETPDPQKGAPR